MDFRLSEIKPWFFAGISSVAALAWAIPPVATDLSGTISALVLGLLSVYLLLSAYCALRFATLVMNFNIKFKLSLSTTSVVVSLLCFAWLVFGRYFYLSAKGAGQFEQQLAIDYIIRNSVYAQVAATTVLNFFVADWRDRTDSVVSIIVGLIVVIFCFG